MQFPLRSRKFLITVTRQTVGRVLLEARTRRHIAKLRPILPDVTRMGMWGAPRKRATAAAREAGGADELAYEVHRLLNIEGR
jgi:hypothetical protein